MSSPDTRSTTPATALTALDAAVVGPRITLVAADADAIAATTTGTGTSIPIITSVPATAALATDDRALALVGQEFDPVTGDPGSTCSTHTLRKRRPRVPAIATHTTGNRALVGDAKPSPIDTRAAPATKHKQASSPTFATSDITLVGEREITPIHPCPPAAAVGTREGPSGVRSVIACRTRTAIATDSRSLVRQLKANATDRCAATARAAFASAQGANSFEDTVATSTATEGGAGTKRQVRATIEPRSRATTATLTAIADTCARTTAPTGSALHAGVVCATT
jgi:hypothetical protein